MERFGKFQLYELIGTGGMAEIHLARPVDAAMSKLVAVKRILPKHAGDPHFKEMFKREGEIALRLRHPSIIAVHELGTVEGRFYMSMEFFPGKPLATLMKNIREKKFALEIVEKVQIIKSIAEALQYMHDFSDYGDVTEIIHRDISPQNIMVGYDGSTRLIDFGIAKIVVKDEQTKTQSLKGKFAYMSPEQVKGEPLTKQTDIFSLGIVLWELLANRKLFTGSSIGEIANKVEACQIPFLGLQDAKVPLDLERVAQKALAKNLDDRYQTAGDLVQDLDAVLRSYRTQGVQKQLARALQTLYADDVARLQDQLKRYEIDGSAEMVTQLYDAASTQPAAPSEKPKPSSKALPPSAATPDPIPAKPESSPPGTVVQAPLSLMPPRKPLSTHHSQGSLGSHDSQRRSRTQKRKNESRLSLWAGAALVVALATTSMILRLWTHLNFERKPAQVPEAEPTATKDPVLSGRLAQPAPTSTPAPRQNFKSASRVSESQELRPAQPRPTMTPKPPPTPTPVPLVLPAPPAPMPIHPEAKLENLNPESAAKSTSIKRRPTKAEKLGSKRGKDSKPEPKQKMEAKAPAKSASNEDKEERTPATQAPLGNFAYLTIFAVPDAQIFVDGKAVGTEMVNELKVPAQQTIAIRVVSKSGGTKTQKMQLKPRSRNVVDLAQ